jgi:hypothetical protein
MIQQPKASTSRWRRGGDRCSGQLTLADAILVHYAWPVDRVRQLGDRSKGTPMPIGPSMLAKSIGTLDLYAADPRG